ncbi:MAG: hypothetical protein HWN51_05375, partial [Desulfobacterales bacterium]|nr:hypothetical protein [Desulfobacterales bacterium]
MTLLIDIRGTTVADTIVEVTVTIQNDDTDAHSVAVRHEWDLMIDDEDDSWIRVWTDPSTPGTWTETETDWVSPAFQFWETTNNPAAPVFSIYGSTVLPLVSPLPTVPDRLVYAAWSGAYNTAYDFATSGRSGMDSAVLYYWNAEEISPGASISRTAYVTTVVGVELVALAWSTDSAGNPKSTFLPSNDVYVRGQDFPAETDVTIYLIPDGEDALPANTVASAAATTDATGDLPNTLVWTSPLTGGEYDIWVDVNRNEVFDAGDAWNNQAVGIYAFTVIPPVQYDLAINVVGSGTTDPAPGTYTYDEGTDVSVDAIPDSGWTLHHWELDGADVADADPYTITMDDDHILTAVFVELEVPPVQYDLTIEVDGSGTTSPPPGAYAYDEGTAVDVDATPSSGWTLSHWLLDTFDAGYVDPYTVIMDSDRRLVAVFVQVPPEPVHDVEAVSQTAAENEVLPGTLVDILVTVGNPGDFTESFNVTCYYDT